MSPFAPEFEAAAADAVAGEMTRASRHALPLGTPCANCGTPLQGAWCHACGQKGEEYHRSIWHLIAEAFEGLTHLDGRVWNTLPKLIYRPGKLTRDYLEGHRAAQIPPFRLFLVALLLVFFAGGLNFSSTHTNFNVGLPSDPKIAASMSPKDRADFEDGMARLRAKTAPGGQKLDIHPAAGSSAFWSERVGKAMANPETLMLAMEQWGHRFAILMLPVAALLLSALFVFKKGVYVFDHLIFSMHSLSFQGLLVTACFLGGIAADWAWQFLWLAPVHLFVHMRGTYRTSVVGTLLRMALLFFGSSIAVAFLFAALVVVGMATMH